jgi:23S rRNA G2445 N2-methylase RlmL
MANKKEILKIKDLYFAICPHTFEDLLIAEMKEIGIKNLDPVKGGVYFESTPELAIELLLKTRFASRVLKQFYSFDIKNEGDLYFFSKEIKWKALFTLEQTFKIDVSLGHSPNGFKRSKFKNTMFLGQKLKDAIVDRFRDDSNGNRARCRQRTS